MEIKLVIWDLDDTLWSGTLAEGDKLELRQDFAEIIRALNIRGVVSSICSKNDKERARSALTKLGLWDQFVFPHVSFSPKGQMISSMIEQMQLRSQNVLFIDDHSLNLQEVRSCEPDINVADAQTRARCSCSSGSSHNMRTSGNRVSTSIGRWRPGSKIGRKTSDRARIFSALAR